MLGIDIKTEWGFDMPIFAIIHKDNNYSIIFGVISKIIVQRTIWNEYVISYEVKDANSDNFYIVKEEHIALNHECLEEMINNGEVDNGE